MAPDTSALDRPMPLQMPLSGALDLVDKAFGIDRVLANEGHDIIAPYYRQSVPGYRRVHSEAGCMHFALNPGGRFDPAGYYAQAAEVARLIGETRATRVLEMGCGLGFNTLHLAPRHPQVAFTGLDLLEDHVKGCTRAAAQAGLTNTQFRQGSHDAMPQDIGRFDVIFAVETLCYARDPASTAAQMAALLNPGGRVVIYDGFRHPDLDRAPPEMMTAARLFEVTTAVTNGFWTTRDWRHAFEATGMSAQERDLAPEVLPGTHRLQKIATRVFTSWKYRLLRRFMPPLLVRNAVAGLMGPYVIQGADPAAGETRPGLSYAMISAQKP